jgi:DNA polymerase III epsilon subunit-like protein
MDKNQLIGHLSQRYCELDDLFLSPVDSRKFLNIVILEYESILSKYNHIFITDIEDILDDQVFKFIEWLDYDNYSTSDQANFSTIFRNIGLKIIAWIIINNKSRLIVGRNRYKRSKRGRNNPFTPDPSLLESLLKDYELHYKKFLDEEYLSIQKNPVPQFVKKVLKYENNLVVNPSKNVLFFDTETTGLPKKWNSHFTNVDNWPRLIQLAFLVCGEFGDVLYKGSVIIKPEGFKIPIESAKIHGITNRYAIDNGYPLKNLLRDFKGLIDNVDLVVGHNLIFDLNILGSEYIRNGMGFNFPKNTLCTMERSTQFCKLPGAYGYKYPKLNELYFKLFNEKIIEDNEHNAYYDIRATAKCFWALKEQNVV